MPYRILSFDGGGMRGYLTLLLLERLTEARPGLLERADLLAGTSSGGLIALCLAAGRSPTHVRETFENCAPSIFADSIFDDVVDLGKVLGAEYASSGGRAEGRVAWLKARHHRGRAGPNTCPTSHRPRR